MGCIAFFIVSILISVSSYVYYDEYGHEAEARIEEIFENNKNIYSQFTQGVRDATKFMNAYEGSFKELVFVVLSRQQSSEGSHSIQKKIVHMIEEGRKNLQHGQSKLIEAKSAYKIKLGSGWEGFWLRRAGYPTIRLSDYPTLTNDDTEIVFKKGKEAEPIKFR